MNDKFQDHAISREGKVYHEFNVRIVSYAERPILQSLDRNGGTVSESASAPRITRTVSGTAGYASHAPRAPALKVTAST